MTKKIIMTGPLPPLMGGMATVLNNLQSSSLASKYNVIFWNTGKETAEDATVLTKIRYFIGKFGAWITLLRQERPDYVHIHTCSGLTFFIDCLYSLIARMLGIKTIMHIHGARFDQFINNMPSLVKKLIICFLNKNDKTIALTNEWKTVFADQWGIQNVEVLLNGVPIENPDPTKADDVIQLLYLGEICKRKGIEDMLAAVANLQSSNFFLNIVGNYGADIPEAALREMVGQYPQLRDQIKIHGPKSGSEKDALFMQSHIFLLPSYAEGLPMSILEAMSYKLAVVTTTVGGLPGLLTHMKNGALHAPGDRNALHDILDQLLNNPQTIKAIADAGFNTFSQKYSIEAVVKDYCDLYGA